MGTEPQWRRRLARWHSAVALAAFLSVGPGIAGVEVAFHLARGETPTHERQVHFEEAGTASHADHCRLSLSPADGRLPTLRVVRPPASGPVIRHSLSAFDLPCRLANPTAALPRAPPPGSQRSPLLG